MTYDETCLIMPDALDKLGEDDDFKYLMGLKPKSAKSFPWQRADDDRLREEIFDVIHLARGKLDAGSCARLVVKVMFTIAAAEAAVSVWKEKGAEFTTESASWMHISECVAVNLSSVQITLRGDSDHAELMFIDVYYSAKPQQINGDLSAWPVRFSRKNEDGAWIESDWFPLRELTCAKAQNFAEGLL